MATLHLINKSPGGSDTFDACLRAIAANDVILLIEDGVYGAMAGTETGRALASIGAALSADVEARGLQGRLSEGIRIVDDEDFVDLCTRCDRVMSWF